MTNAKHPVSRRTFLAGAAAVSGMAALPGARAFAGEQRARPNIVFIMADDMGYADAGCYGARHIATPHIDSLAADGLQLFNGYSNSAVCSPTRLALITGRYQYRLPFGLEEPGGSSGLGLAPGLPTLPAQLQRQGYRTALVGKWHLGMLPDYSPLKSGYERFYGIPNGGVDYFRHVTIRDGEAMEMLTEGEATVDQHGYLTDLLGERAVAEVNDAAQDGKPLFLSLHFTAPHWPWIGPEDDAVSQSLDRNILHLDGGNLETYARMVESMDANIGKVLAALERNGLADNTIVVFTSDNGGERFSDTWPFVGTKTELLEGGIRVPLLVRWPARISPGTTSSQVMTSMDFLPTLLAAAGATPDPGFAPDGDNLLDVLVGASAPRPRTLYWRYNANDQRAVRDGDWKYLKIRNREYLFNLAEDQRERANLRNKYPQRFADLKAKYDAWNATMLPYGEDSYSHSVSGFLSDRYP